MRTLYVIFFICAISSVNSNAQRRDKMSYDRIESQRIAFITTQLDLMPEESQIFWPVYNEFQKRFKEIKFSHQPMIGLEDLNEENAEQLVMGILAIQDAELKLRKEYINKLKGVLPMVKIAKLQLLEREFKKQMLISLKKRKNYRQEKERK